MAATSSTTIGELVAKWRRLRRFSQLDLALEAGVSQRHLSFIETGRSVPSRSMLLHLAEHLLVPVRERNALLLAAGYAPSFVEQSFDAPGMVEIYRAVQAILAGHSPCPSLAVDRHWNLVIANEAAMRLLEDIDTSVLEPPINVLRVSLHPQGLGPRVLNYLEWRAHILARLSRQIEISGDEGLSALRDEITSFPVTGDDEPDLALPAGYHPVAIPLRLNSRDGPLSFISTTTVFGSALEITTSELTIESFFPADAHTAELLWRGTRSGQEEDGRDRAQGIPPSVSAV